MANWSEGNVHTNGLNLHYYRTGGDKAPVLLLHGVTDSGLCWTRVAKELEQDYDLIMLDARGHGLSDVPADGLATEAQAADVAGVIQALGLERPRLLGHSMGAATAAQVAASYPDLVRAIVLEDPPWHDFERPAQPTEGKPDRPLSWIDALKAQPREERIANARKANPAWSEEELGPWADSKDQFRAQVGGGFRITPWREVVSKISCPVLLITADPERGAIVTPADVQEIERTWQNGRAIHIAGAGHNIRREQYEPFITAVKEFFKEH